MRCALLMRLARQGPRRTKFSGLCEPRRINPCRSAQAEGTAPATSLLWAPGPSLSERQGSAERAKDLEAAHAGEEEITEKLAASNPCATALTEGLQFGTPLCTFTLFRDYGSQTNDLRSALSA